LLTHSLYPLYKTFLEELDYEVVLSDIDEEKELMTNAPFCYPIQILHGATLDLVRKNITTIFLPHVHKMPIGEDWTESTFCPITQASPYFIRESFRDVTILSPVLDFEKGYEFDKSLVKMAIETLKQPKKKAVAAFEKAVKKQKDIEAQFIQWGKEVIEKIKGTNEIGILLVGRSYNAFPPETSLSIPRKLASMGVNVIPFDFLEKGGKADIPWFFANYAKAAIDIALQYENLYVLYINSFSCTIDAFSQNYLRTEMGTKPYLMLELDAHSADAGIQTRLEAFLEIIKNYQSRKRVIEEQPFQVAQVKRRNGKVVVITSEGKAIDIKDPRVTLHLPSFSKYHTDIGERVLKMFGYNVGESSDIKLEYLIKGFRCSSGKECIPLPVVLGQIMSLVEKRKPGELIGLYMIRGGSPCAVYSYFHYIEQFLEKNKIENVFIFRFDYLTKFLGMKLQHVIRFIPPALIIGDLIAEIDSSIQVVGEEGSFALLQKYWFEFLDSIVSKKKFRRGIRKLIRHLASIPRKYHPRILPKVLITGDFFVRFSPFFLKELRDIYAQNGIIVKSTDLFELGVYGTHFNGGYLATKEWNMNPDKVPALLRASATPWDDASRILLMSRVGIKVMYVMEKRLRKRFERTGLLYAHQNDLGKIIDHASPKISRLIFGEAIPSIGKGMETLEGSDYDSLILTGPFNCLPYKIAQAILKPVYQENNKPLLVFDVDITSMTPNMKRLIQANIEHIKRRREIEVEG
ncbi:MAG TPA: acyl-CoA dehydratase activase-related protein, partial [Candidatus Bathyarchaeia archaeon]|nr:acyl-CoA dehydratase activase-related protein [Candidatus Bathyarchaeia archaeon]